MMMYKGRTPEENSRKDGAQVAFIVVCLLVAVFTFWLDYSKSGMIASKAGKTLKMNSPKKGEILKNKMTIIQGVASTDFVILEKNSEQVVKAPVAPDGKFSMEIATDRLVGQFNLVARDKDGLAIETLESVTFDPSKEILGSKIADPVTPPPTNSPKPVIKPLAITYPKEGGSLRVGLNQVEGTGVPGTTIALRLDSFVVSRPKVDIDGRWIAIFDLDRASDSRSLAASTAVPLRRTPPIKVSVDP